MITKSFQRSGTTVKIERLTGTQKYMPFTVAGINSCRISRNDSPKLEPVVNASYMPIKPKKNARRAGLNSNYSTRNQNRVSDIH